VTALDIFLHRSSPSFLTDCMMRISNSITSGDVINFKKKKKAIKVFHEKISVIEQLPDPAQI
jgi:hypothetical protein